MTTAVDTCVVLDLLLDEPQWSDRAEAALRQAFDQGQLIIGEVVYAELMPQFHGSAELEETLNELGILFIPSCVSMAAAAGLAWAQYRRSGGPRNRLIGDFLVGAHAAVNADRLLTRDGRYYQSSFATLTIIEP